MSVEILSTVETSCTTNPQQIAVTESGVTVDRLAVQFSLNKQFKQPRLVDCRTGVVNKLDRRRRRRRVLLTTRSTCRGEIHKVRSLDIHKCHSLNSLIKQCGIGGRQPPCMPKPVVSIQYRLVTDGRTDGRTDGHMMTANTALAWRRAVK